jgi:branched-chain amino acid transport system substrate-binding protein
MTEFAKGNFGEAAKQFRLIRKTASEDRAPAANDRERNDANQVLRNPLPLIYEGNAIARERNKATGQAIYSFGVAVPLNTDPGVDTLRGVALMQQNAIKAGINVEFVLANDRNLPDQSKEIAQALVNRSEILAVIGHYASPNTCAGLSVYDPANLVLISPLSTVLNLRSNCSTTQNRVFFRTSSSTRVEAETLIRYLYDPQGLDKSNPKVAVFYNPKESGDPRTAFSPDLTKQFGDQLREKEGEILGEAIDLSNQNFNAEAALQQVQDADALAVLPGGQFDQLAFQNAVKLIEANQGRKVVLGANPLYLQEVFDQVSQQAGDGALVNKLIMAVEWQQQCGAGPFLAEVAETYVNGGINRRTALAYEAAQVLINKLTPGIKRSQMRNALATGTPIQSDVVDNSSISFDAKGDRKEYASRILVTLKREKGQLMVVPLNNECKPF